MFIMNDLHAVSDLPYTTNTGQNICAMLEIGVRSHILLISNELKQLSMYY